MLQQLGQPDPRPGSWEADLHWGGLLPGLLLPEPSPVMARLELDTPL